MSKTLSPRKRKRNKIISVRLAQALLFSCSLTFGCVLLKPNEEDIATTSTLENDIIAYHVIGAKDVSESEEDTTSEITLQSAIYETAFSSYQPTNDIMMVSYNDSSFIEEDSSFETELSIAEETLAETASYIEVKTVIDSESFIEEESQVETSVEEETLIEAETSIEETFVEAETSIEEENTVETTISAEDEYPVEVETESSVEEENSANPQPFVEENEFSYSDAGNYPYIWVDRSHISLTKREINILCNVVWHESGASCIEGQIAVAAVILNRLESDDFDSDIYSIITAPNQFDTAYAAEVGENFIPQGRTYEAVMLALQGYDYSMGAVYFYNPKLVTNKQTLRWFNSLTTANVIEGHTFKYSD